MFIFYFGKYYTRLIFSFFDSVLRLYRRRAAYSFTKMRRFFLSSKTLLRYEKNSPVCTCRRCIKMFSYPTWLWLCFIVQICYLLIFFFKTLTLGKSNFPLFSRSTFKSAIFLLGALLFDKNITIPTVFLKKQTDNKWW